MKVLLIKPSNLSDHIQPSLGLGYLASQIRGEHEVRIVDCIKDNLTGPELRPALEEFRPDVVGSQCYSMDLPKVREVFETVKGFNPETVTIVGGAHPTAVPEETMRFLGPGLLDYVFVGEGEIGFPLLLKELEKSAGRDLSAVPGLGRMVDGELKLNATAAADDLDSLGMPAWDLIMPEKYPFSPHGVVCKNFPIAPVMATRGCPFHCTFCSIAGSKVRLRSIPLILDEIKLLHSRHGIKEFHMVDDNFTHDMDYAKELLDGIIKLNLKASWATPNGVRLDRLDREIIDLMKRAGFYSISVGIESGSERIRKKMKKGMSLDKIREYLKMINDAGGIDVTAFFILGFPGETKEDIEKSLRFSRELPIQRATFHSFIPLPGAEIWKELEEEGKLARVDWDNYFFWAGAYVPDGMTHEDLKKFHRRAFFRFYMRPRIIMQNMKFLTHPRVMMHAMKYLWRRL